MQPNVFPIAALGLCLAGIAPLGRPDAGGIARAQES
jgi:hypothetical protein